MDTVKLDEMTKEEACAVLDDMKVKIDIPHAAVMQRKRNEALDMAISALKDEWIPVSKRLPDVEHVVYCQLTDGSHEILFLNDCEGRMTWIGRRTGTYNVIAWREMPESYKGE